MVIENQFIAGLTYRESAQCALPADLALVPEVAGKVRTYCLQRGLDPETWASLELALVEGLNNAIEHGCRGLREANIQVRWNWTDELLEIEILDPGQYRPPSIPARLPDPLAEGGRGLYVMSALMDGVSHRSHEGNHLLVLRKKLGPPRPADEDRETALDGMTGELSNSYETIAALFHFCEELATARSYDEFVQQVLRRLFKLVRGDEAWLRIAALGGGLKLAGEGRAPRHASMPESLGPEDDVVETQVFREAQQQTIEDCSELKPGDPLRRESGCAFVCPILFRHTTSGVLSVLREQTSPYFTAGETRLVSAVADFLGIARTIALSQDHRLAQLQTERELEIAAEIQHLLLPKAHPETGRSRVFGLSQMAREVGGDYFDFLPIGDKAVLLVVADVMGKGVPAALLATILRTTIRAHSDLAEDPGRLLTLVNRQLSVDLNNLDMFITVQIAFLSDETDELIFASAGHCPLLIFPQGAVAASQRRGGGIPIGILNDVEYESMREPIAPGDRFIFLSDGIYEVQSAAGVILGLDALARQIPALCTGDPRSDCRRLLDYVDAYSAGTPAADDRTVLVAQRH